MFLVFLCGAYVFVCVFFFRKKMHSLQKLNIFQNQSFLVFLVFLNLNASFHCIFTISGLLYIFFFSFYIHFFTLFFLSFFGI